jgi:hypothetical protein
MREKEKKEKKKKKLAAETHKTANSIRLSAPAVGAATNQALNGARGRIEIQLRDAL